MQKAAAEEEAKKPKRTFMMPNQGSAFSQMMRQQMAGSDLAPRKLDSMDKRNYKEMGSNQAATAKDKVQAVNEKAKQRSTNADRPKTGGAAANDEGFSNWRAGNFGATPAQATTLGEEVKGAGGN